jgi:hypothetical protein
MTTKETVPDHILVFSDNFGNINLSAGYDYEMQCNRVVVIDPIDVEIVCQWLRSCRDRIKKE